MGISELSMVAAVVGRSGCCESDDGDTNDVAGSGWATRYVSKSVRNCCCSSFTAATISKMVSYWSAAVPVLSVV